MNWSELDSIPHNGLYAVVVTSDINTISVASGYAKTISEGLRTQFPERTYLGIRLGQPGTNNADKIEDDELNIFANWVEGNAFPRREGNVVTKGAVIYIERFDKLSPIAISLIEETAELGLDVIIVSAADIALPPSKNSLASFPAVRIINLPSSSNEKITTAEMKL